MMVPSVSDGGQPADSPGGEAGNPDREDRSAQSEQKKDRAGNNLIPAAHLARFEDRDVRILRIAINRDAGAGRITPGMLARLLLAHITEVAEPDTDRGALPRN